MKKFSLLFAMLLMFVSGAWADEVEGISTTKLYRVYNDTRISGTNLYWSLNSSNKLYCEQLRENDFTQVWKFTYNTETGKYTIQNYGDNLYIPAVSGNTEQSIGSSSTEYTVVKDGDYYTFNCSEDGTTQKNYLFCDQASNNYRLDGWSDGSNQKFKLEEYTKPSVETTYTIHDVEFTSITSNATNTNTDNVSAKYYRFWRNSSAETSGLSVTNYGGVKINNSSAITVKYLNIDNTIVFQKSTNWENGSINWTSGGGFVIKGEAGAWVDVNSTYTSSNIDISSMTSGSIYLNEGGKLSLASEKILAATNKVYATLGNDFTDSRTLIEGDFSTWTSQNLNTQVVITNNSKKVIVIEGTTDGLIVKAVSSITRSTTTNSYGTICLPYDATVEGAVVMAFTGRSANGLVFTPVDGNAIQAGVPYLYRATADAQTFTTTGTTYTEATAVKGFTGSYTEIDLSKTADNTTYNYFLYTQDNKFHPAGTYVHMGAYRCYFPTLPSVSEARVSSNSVVFGIYGDATTGISTLNTSVDLNKDGKFIQNGRMVIVNNGKKFNAAGQIVK